MSDFHVLIPKLGESIQEATVTKLFVKQGDIVKEDEILFEIATDKVDSEIPSPVSGMIKEIRCSVDDLIPVGQTVIVIETETDGMVLSDLINVSVNEDINNHKDSSDNTLPLFNSKQKLTDSGRFYSPLVKSIAAKEGVTLTELESIRGSGLGGRVQKNDIISYVERRNKDKKNYHSQPAKPISPTGSGSVYSGMPKVSVSFDAGDIIVKMDRIRKLIAANMVISKQISPHVTTVVEADVTNLVLWRNSFKDEFERIYGQKLTFMPVFVEATAKALSEFRQVNASVDEDTIILHKHINIAVATSDGNLVVPVIKDADSKNIVGISREISTLAKAGRVGKLTPDDVQGGTFTITNFGSFRGLIGTPIINQPQVAILAVGMIEKKPAVMETSTGDAIVVRHKMFLSLSYDHRVVDGMLGGKFLRRIADLLEQFEQNLNG